MHKAILLMAIVGSFSITAIGPAAAAGKGAPINDVKAACKRTAGCSFTPEGPGAGIGCSPKVCFFCSGGKCTQSMKGHPNGRGAMLGGVRLPPGNIKTSGGQADRAPRRPINTGTGLKPVVGSGIHAVAHPAGGGMEHGDRNRRH